jgi:DNA-directed RNA polymerase specialized sigma24 family protein
MQGYDHDAANPGGGTIRSTEGGTMQHQHDVPVRTAGATLADRSVDGDEDAFAELYEQHAGLGWRYAYALTGTSGAAVEVTAEGFSRAFTMLRGDLGMPQEFRPLLLHTTRNAAVDRLDVHDADARPFETAEDVTALATAFAALPERWRSALWLGEVEGEDPRSVASILGLEDLDATEITARACTGLREQYLRADVAATPGRNCARSVRRLGPYVAGTLP